MAFTHYVEGTNDKKKSSTDQKNVVVSYILVPKLFIIRLYLNQSSRVGEKG